MAAQQSKEGGALQSKHLYVTFQSKTAVTQVSASGRRRLFYGTQYSTVQTAKFDDMPVTHKSLDALLRDVAVTPEWPLLESARSPHAGAQ